MSCRHFAVALVCAVFLSDLIGQTDASSLFGKKIEKKVVVEEKSDTTLHEKKEQIESLLEKLKSLEDRVLEAKKSLDTDKEKAADELEEVDIIKTLKEEKKPKKEKVAVDIKNEAVESKKDAADNKEKGADSVKEKEVKTNHHEEKENKKNSVTGDHSAPVKHGVGDEEVKDDSDDDSDDKEDEEKYDGTVGEDKDEDDDKGNDDDDGTEPRPQMKEAESAVKKISSAAGKMSNYMKELNEAAKSTNENKKEKAISENDDQNDFDEWVQEKMDLAEKAMEQFEALLNTLSQLFSFEEMNSPLGDNEENEVGLKKPGNQNLVALKEKEKLQSRTGSVRPINLVEKKTNYENLRALKEKLTGKISEVSGSVTYLDNMIKSFGKMFSKK